MAATLASLSSQPNLTIQPTSRGLPGSILDRHMSRDREEVDMVDREEEGKENMPSCRLEARNNSLEAGHANKRVNNLDITLELHFYNFYYFESAI